MVRSRTSLPANSLLAMQSTGNARLATPSCLGSAAIAAATAARLEPSLSICCSVCLNMPAPLEGSIGRIGGRAGRPAGQSRAAGLLAERSPGSPGQVAGQTCSKLPCPSWARLESEVPVCVQAVPMNV